MVVGAFCQQKGVSSPSAVCLFCCLFPCIWSHMRAAPKGQACMIHGIMHAHCNTELLYHILLYVFNMLYTCMSRVGEEMYTILLKLHGFQTHCVRNAICTIHMVHFFICLQLARVVDFSVFFFSSSTIASCRGGPEEKQRVRTSKH